MSVSSAPGEATAQSEQQPCRFRPRQGPIRRAVAGHIWRARSTIPAVWDRHAQTRKLVYAVVFIASHAHSLHVAGSCPRSVHLITYDIGTQGKSLQDSRFFCKFPFTNCCKPQSIRYASPVPYHPCPPERATQRVYGRPLIRDGPTRCHDDQEQTTAIRLRRMPKAHRSLQWSVRE